MARRRAPRRLAPAARADSREGLLELVADGASVNIAGESATRRHQREELAYVPIDDIEPATVVLCSLSDTRNPMVQVFRETALELSALISGTLHSE